MGGRWGYLLILRRVAVQSATLRQFFRPIVCHRRALCQNVSSNGSRQTNSRITQLFWHFMSLNFRRGRSHSVAPEAIWKWRAENTRAKRRPKKLMCPSTFLRCTSSSWQGITENRVDTAKRREFTFKSDYETCNIDVHRVSKKCATFIFTIISATVDQFSYFSLLNSERICGRSWTQNFHIPLNLLPHYTLSLSLSLSLSFSLSLSCET